MGSDSKRKMAKSLGSRMESASPIGVVSWKSPSPTPRKSNISPVRQKLGKPDKGNLLARYNKEKGEENYEGEGNISQLLFHKEPRELSEP